MIVKLYVSGLADSISKSEIYHCKLQPTDFVRGNVDLKTNGEHLLVRVALYEV